MSAHTSQYHACDLILEKSELGAIYLGDINSAVDIEFLESHHISTVIKATSGTIDVKYPNFISHIVQPLIDIQCQDVAQYFDSTFQLIEDSRKIGNLLVHCSLGISRSATLVIGYLIKKFKLTYEDAYAVVKSKRIVISPHQSFIVQLQKYSKAVASTIQD